MEEGAEGGSAGGPAGAHGAGCCQRKEQGRGGDIVAVVVEEVVVVAAVGVADHTWIGMEQAQEEGTEDHKVILAFGRSSEPRKVWMNSCRVRETI